MSASPAAVVQAQGLGFLRAGVTVLADLSFTIGPGLTWVRGAEGRGKSSLLRLLAGDGAPTAGTLRREAASVYFEDSADPAEDATVAQAWLDARRARHAGWNRAEERRLVEALGLAEHLGKPLHMLSTGSRRKVGLVGASASGAALTLVDAPFAALDAPSVRELMALFDRASRNAHRTWVVADHECPPALAGVPRIDLGD